MKPSALIIFVKNPEPGKVKTRLATAIGDELSFHIYLRLLRLTRELSLKVDAERHVFYSSFIPSTDAFEEPEFHRMLQSEGDLGKKMKDAFNRLFAEDFEKVVIIGSDCPDLTHEHIAIAFDLLDSADVVLGPANDGGYYLLGLKKMIPEIFTDKAWSTPGLLDQTLSELEALNKQTILLDELGDIDTIDDLRSLRPDWLPVSRPR